MKKSVTLFEKLFGKNCQRIIAAYLTNLKLSILLNESKDQVEMKARLIYNVLKHNYGDLPEEREGQFKEGDARFCVNDYYLKVTIAMAAYHYSVDKDKAKALKILVDESNPLSVINLIPFLSDKETPNNASKLYYMSMILEKMNIICEDEYVALSEKVLALNDLVNDKGSVVNSKI